MRAATSRRSLEACIASFPLLSFLMSKAYFKSFKSDHLNGGGSSAIEECPVACIGLGSGPIHLGPVDFFRITKKRDETIAMRAMTQPIAEIRICSSLGDLHESLLDELCRSCHGIRIDLDVRQQVLVSPAMGLCGRAAKLDLHAALLQIGNEILVGVARRDVAICVVCRVVQSHMPGIRMEDCDDLRGRAPARDVVL